MVLGVVGRISNWAINTKRIKRPLKNEPSPIMIDIAVAPELLLFRIQNINAQGAQIGNNLLYIHLEC